MLGRRALRVAQERYGTYFQRALYASADAAPHASQLFLRRAIFGGIEARNFTIVSDLVVLTLST